MSAKSRVEVKRHKDSALLKTCPSNFSIGPTVKLLLADSQRIMSRLTQELFDVARQVLIKLE